MDFRRSGQLDGRRRRVLMDTSAAGGDENDDSNPAPSSGRGPVRAYAPAVLADRQPRLTDLIPQRPFFLLMLALLGLTAIASIECVYIHLHPTISAGTALPGVDLSQRASFASWFSSIFLACGAAAAVVIYSMRVHRVDDYRGRYRVWLWTSAALLLASVHAVTGLHETVNAAFLLLTGISPEGAGAFLWLALYAAVFGGLGVWLAIEVWPSLEAFGALTAAATLLVLATVAHLGLLPLGGTLTTTVATSTLVMLAHGAVVYSLVLYARHVHLDAQGRLLVQVEKSKRKKAKRSTRLAVIGSDEAAEPKRKKSGGADKRAAADDQEAAAKDGATKSGAKPGGASISAATLKSPPLKPLAVADGDDDADGQDGDKLSRAERRRLKKLAQQGSGSEGQRRAA